MSIQDDIDAGNSAEFKNERLRSMSHSLCRGGVGHIAKEYTEQHVLKAIYESGLHQYAPGVIRTSFKDGIDIDIPHSALLNFVRTLTATEG